MSATKAITLRLEAEDYERLEAEATRLGMRPGTLVRVYVRAGLANSGESEAEKRRRIGLEVLDRLEALRADLRRAGYPSVDAVQLARESRDEFEQRPPCIAGLP